MRKEVFGLILAGEDNVNLQALVKDHRSVGALPIGSKYRVVDFALSNMINSGIRDIGVLPRKNYRSLVEHLGSGKEWDLDRKNGGLVILPPYVTVENQRQSGGLLDNLQGAADYMRHVSQPYCLFSGSHTVYNGTYEKMLQFHQRNNADITIMYNVEAEALGSERYQDVRLATDDDGRVTDISYGAVSSPYRKIGMDTYLIKKDLLTYLLDEALSRGKEDLITDVFMPNLRRLRIYGCLFRGYVGRLHNVSAYYDVNMALLRRDVQQEVFFNGHPLYTKTMDGFPSKYGPEAQVTNSLVGSGCRIEGTVENSVIFRDVQVGKGVQVRNSIVMDGTVLHDHTQLNCAILDKNVHIMPGTVLSGSRKFPVLIPKEAVVQ